MIWGPKRVNLSHGNPLNIEKKRIIEVWEVGTVIIGKENEVENYSVTIGFRWRKTNSCSNWRKLIMGNEKRPEKVPFNNLSEAKSSAQTLFFKVNKSLRTTPQHLKCHWKVGNVFFKLKKKKSFLAKQSLQTVLEGCVCGQVRI